MIISLIIGLATWAAVATYFLIKTIRRNERLIAFDRESSELLAEYPAEKKLDAHITLHELREKHVPWFQKSLSTFGVIAFFSMSAAALTQTISAQVNAFKAQSAEQRYNEAKEMADATERANERSIKAILALRNTDIYLSKEMTDLLYDRLIHLSDPKRNSQTAAADVKEQMIIAMALGRANCAAQIWQASSDITLSELNVEPADVVTFGELYYLIRDDTSARKSLEHLDYGRLKSKSVAFRSAALRVALAEHDPTRLLADHVDQLSRRFTGDTSQMHDRLVQQVEQLRRERARMRLDATQDFCARG